MWLWWQWKERFGGTVYCVSIHRGMDKKDIGIVCLQFTMCKTSQRFETCGLVQIKTTLKTTLKLQ